MKHTQFYKDIDVNYQFVNDDIFSFMKAVKSLSMTQAVIHNSVTQSSSPPMNNNTTHVAEYDEIDTSSQYESVSEFAVNSQTELQFSQQRENISDTDSEDALLQSAAYYDAKARFDNAWHCCNNEDDRSTLMKCISDFTSTLASKNKGNIKDVETGGTIFYGANPTKKRRIGRKMTRGEQVLRKMNK